MASSGITSDTQSSRSADAAEGSARDRTDRRLRHVLETARHVPFDDRSRIVFFSDCHRGDNGRADAFARNSGLYLDALSYYYRHGFTYVEVGDGDELWQNRRFSDVRRAYGRIFDLFHAFAQQHRLYLIVGNHDIQRGRRDQVEKDGLVAHEGLVLQHVISGQRLFVVHGHQADFKSDRLPFLGRAAVRALKHVQWLGLARHANLPADIWTQSKIDGRIREWARNHRQMVVCGHTHRPACASYDTPPYFNTGSCLVPGAITGLEVEDGRISLVRWMSRPDISHRGQSGARRELVVPPRRLCRFA